MSKNPRLALHGIWAFPPNRETYGGTAYLIVENSRNILIDCPIWDDDTQAFLAQHGGVNCLAITHRQGISPAVAPIQDRFGCEIVIQEQEAYLLPGAKTTPFQHAWDLSPSTQLIWTPGYSPGSACVYHQEQGGVLFTGRHLLPDTAGMPQPLRTVKTFHWRRQLENVQRLLDRFTVDTLRYICPGANTGFLRQERYIDQAYAKLQALDLATLLAS